MKENRTNSSHGPDKTIYTSDGVNSHYTWKYLTWDTAAAIEDENIHLTLAGSDRHNQLPKRFTKITDPTTWSPKYKLYLGVVGMIANFSTTYTGGSYTSATAVMAEEWHTSDVAVLLGVTVYTLSFALAPMVLAPFSELNGRRPVILVSGVLFAIGVLFCAVTRLYVGMILARILVGLANSTFAVIIVGVAADVHTEARERYNSLALFTGGAMFGSGCGPLVSAFIVQSGHWRWLFGWFAIFCAGMVIVFALTFKETRGPVLLSRKAKALNAWYQHLENESATQNSNLTKATHNHPSCIRYKVLEDEQRGTLAQMILTSLTRPLNLLFTEPVVFFFSLWAAFAWATMYAMLIVVPYTFQTVYDFDLQTSSAVFAAMCIASIIMTFVAHHHDTISSWLVPESRRGSPEQPLYPVAVESCLLPIGLFWFGWSAQAGAHWIVPTLGLACATMGMFSVYLAVFAYLAAAYKQYASSANAAQSMCRNLMGGAFPLFSRVMFQRLGFGGACSLLGAVGVVLTFVPWVLIFYGPRIRARSKYAFGEDRK